MRAIRRDYGVTDYRRRRSAIANPTALRRSTTGIASRPAGPGNTTTDRALEPLPEGGSVVRTVFGGGFQPSSFRRATRAFRRHEEAADRLRAVKVVLRTVGTLGRLVGRLQIAARGRSRRPISNQPAILGIMHARWKCRANLGAWWLIQCSPGVNSARKPARKRRSSRRGRWQHVWLRNRSAVADTRAGYICDGLPVTACAAGSQEEVAKARARVQVTGE